VKTGENDIVEVLEKRHGEYYMDELTPEEFTEQVLQALVDEELPELEKHLEKFEGKQFTTLGKIQLLSEIEDKVMNK
jgi:hypothetical protein